MFNEGGYQMAAALMPAAGVSFSLNWIGDARNALATAVTRVDDRGMHRWHPPRLVVRGKVLCIAREVEKADEPIGSVMDPRLESFQKPKMRRSKRAAPAAREVGELCCQVDDKHVFSFRLNTNNVLLVNFVWLGDRHGSAMLHVSLDGSSPPLKIPSIGFGDQVVFGSTLHTPSQV